MEEESLWHWFKTYMLDIFVGMLFWGAVVCCILLGVHYYTQGRMLGFYLTILLGVLVLGFSIYLLYHFFWSKKRKNRHNSV